MEAIYIVEYLTELTLEELQYYKGVIEGLLVKQTKDETREKILKGKN